MPLRTLTDWPWRAVRHLRWTIGAWSKDSDRSYHERLYEAQDHDPFHTDYPGFVTIRRFADHVEPLLPARGTVLDVGCGPGEITCELARRHPQLTFIGIDHSAAAIRRASRNADRLGLTNARFLTGDAEQLAGDETYGLVTMFDAFHHLERPRQFLDWLRTRSTRCLLIEPAGTASGRWSRDMDVDWLLADLASIRDRLESLCGVDPLAENPSAAPAQTSAQTQAQPSPGARGDALARGEGAVERRYALTDFARFFDGWQLRVTGTIAGFDSYPPRPHARGGLRPVAGDVAYALVRAAEELLLRQDRDGAAKHWVIAATTEAGVIEPRLPSLASAPVDARGDARAHRRVASAYDVRYVRYDGPEEMKAGAEIRATLEIENAGWDEWRSDGPAPVHICYHWLSSGGEMREHDGLRSDLPHPLGSGERCRAFITVRTPAQPGDYLLAIDLVKEGVTWFSEAGVPWHTINVRVGG